MNVGDKCGYLRCWFRFSNLNSSLVVRRQNSASSHTGGVECWRDNTAIRSIGKSGMVGCSGPALTSSHFYRGNFRFCRSVLQQHFDI
jgi:hypothetical protein